MFGTKLGATTETAMDLYLRPETAQGIFVNYLNVQKTSAISYLSVLPRLVKHSVTKL
jgi:glycyl-tRNA synthetase (class II)